MTDNQLSVTYIEVAAGVGDYLGYGRGATFYEEVAWTSRNERAIKESLKLGANWFYNTPPIDKFDPGAYEWSFLEPMATLDLASGAQVIELPADFQSVSGPMTLTADDSRSSQPIHFYGIPQIYAKYAENPTTTGRPVMACQEPMKGRSNQFGQQFQIRVWPIADDDYQVNLPYKIVGAALTAEQPYIYGGPAHTHTIMAACVAAAEYLRDNKKGPRWQGFIEMLQTSIRSDRLNKQQFMGRNRDYSDLQDRAVRNGIRGNPLVSITSGGITY